MAHSENLPEFMERRCPPLIAWREALAEVNTLWENSFRGKDFSSPDVVEASLAKRIEDRGFRVPPRRDMEEQEVCKAQFIKCVVQCWIAMGVLTITPYAIPVSKSVPTHWDRYDEFKAFLKKKRIERHDLEAILGGVDEEDEEGHIDPRLHLEVKSKKRKRQP